MSMEHWTSSNLEKEYNKDVYCYFAYLTHMQRTSCKMPGWMNHKLESRLYIVTLLINLYSEYILQSDELDESQAGIKIARRNINNLRYADGTTLKAGSEEE